MVLKRCCHQAILNNDARAHSVARISEPLVCPFVFNVVEAWLETKVY